MQLEQNVDTAVRNASQTSWDKQKKRYYNYRQVYLLILPGIIYFLIFKIAPMWGLILAFKDYNPFVGIWGSEWVMFRNFTDFFSSQYFYMMLRNTIVISVMNLIFFFPAPILLALLLNEVRSEKFKRINQTIVYMPHFLSWVVITGLTFFMLSTDVGLINKVIVNSGGNPVAFLSDPKLFWWMILLQNIWKEVGWGTIIFLASISQIDPSMYEAAIIDGATRIQKILYITIPSIIPTIIVLFIIRLGHVMDVSFEQILLMYNPFVRDVAEVFDTYSYNQGIMQSNYSIAVTVGIFKGIVGLFLVLISNKSVKKLGHEGIY